MFLTGRGFIALKNKVMEQRSIITQKGHSIAAHLFIPEGIILGETILVVSANGVKQSFYEPIATYFSQQGYHVVTFDYTGIGKSLSRPLKEETTTAYEWANNDLEAMIQWALKRDHSSKIHLMGHSIGGQIIGLAPSSNKASSILIIASQSGYWGFWPGLSRYRYWVNWTVLFPVLLGVFRYLPSKKVMGMENLPRYVAKEWSVWCRNKDYLIGEIDASKRFYSTIQSPLYAFSIDDDSLAPKAAVDWMAAQYHNCYVKRIHLTPADYQVKKIGHFGLFRPHFKDLIWPLFLDALQNKMVKENVS